MKAFTVGENMILVIRVIEPWFFDRYLTVFMSTAVVDERWRRHSTGPQFNNLKSYQYYSHLSYSPCWFSREYPGQFRMVAERPPQSVKSATGKKTLKLSKRKILQKWTKLHENLSRKGFLQGRKITRSSMVWFQRSDSVSC